jgi:hypothetical protein
MINESRLVEAPQQQFTTEQRQVLIEFGIQTKNTVNSLITRFEGLLRGNLNARSKDQYKSILESLSLINKTLNSINSSTPVPELLRYIQQIQSNIEESRNNQKENDTKSSSNFLKAIQSVPLPRLESDEVELMSTVDSSKMRELYEKFFVNNVEGFGQRTSGGLISGDGNEQFNMELGFKPEYFGMFLELLETLGYYDSTTETISNQIQMYRGVDDQSTVKVHSTALTFLENHNAIIADQFHGGYATVVFDLKALQEFEENTLAAQDPKTHLNQLKNRNFEPKIPQDPNQKMIDWIYSQTPKDLDKVFQDNPTLGQKISHNLNWLSSIQAFIRMNSEGKITQIDSIANQAPFTDEIKNLRDQINSPAEFLLSNPSNFDELVRPISPDQFKQLHARLVWIQNRKTVKYP